MNDLQLLWNWQELLRDRPVLLLVFSAAPLALFAWIKRIYPSRLMVGLFAVPCVVTSLLLIPQSVEESASLLLKKYGVSLIITSDLAFLAIIMWDMLSLPGRKAFAAHRDCQRIASLGQDHPVTITVDNRSRQGHLLWARDDVPDAFAATPEEFRMTLPPTSRSAVQYRWNPKQRGSFQMAKIYLRAQSRLGLWHRFLDYEALSTVHVYPDMRQLSKYAVLARTNRLSLMGVRRTRRIGQDNEFERLRDYTPDDNYRYIDWRGTARRRRLMVREFQTNQSQRVMFLVDCGRMMTNSSVGISLLDHALNAVLMLSYVALRQGDSVGMIGFSDRICSYVPTRSGAHQMNRLLHASFDRFPELVESRYDQAFSYLGTHSRKRSLVILISNVIDDVNANQIQRHLGTLVGRHLPLGVLLRDHRLFDAADSPPLSKEDSYRSGAAAEILTWRHQVLRDLEHQGVLSLDVFPEDLAAPLVNKYLEIKARHLL